MLANLATAFGVLMAISPIFQLWQLRNRQTSDDISMHSPAIVLVGALIWTAYGIKIGSDPVIITNALTAVMQILMLVITYKLRSQKRRKTDCPVEAVHTAQSHLRFDQEKWEDHHLCEQRTSELLWALNYLGWELKPKPAKFRA